MLKEDETLVKKSNIIYHNAAYDVYDDLCGEHGNAVLSHFIHDYKLKILQKYIPVVSNALAIDIGTGTGNYAIRLHKLSFLTVIGADISHRMLLKCKKKEKRLFLICCDAETLPFRDGTFDVATMNSILHHLPNPLKAIGEVNRVLKDNGIFLIGHEPHKIRFFGPDKMWPRGFPILDALSLCLIFLLKRIKGNRSNLVKQKESLISERIARELSFRGLLPGDIEREVQKYRSTYVDFIKGFTINELTSVIEDNGLRVIQIWTDLFSSHYFLIQLRDSVISLKLLFTLEAFIRRIPALQVYGWGLSAIAEK